MPELDLRSLILEEFSTRKQRNPRYSLRNFAKYLDLNYTSLHLFINGNRGIKEATCRKILKKLQHDSAEPPHLEVMQQASRYGVLQPSEDDLVTLFRRWIDFAVLSLIEIKPVTDAQEIAARLGVSGELAEHSLKLLVRVKLIVKGDDGLFYPQKSQPLSAGVNGISDLIRHRAIDSAERVIATTKTLLKEKRDIAPSHFSQVICAANPKQFEAVKLEIAKLRRKIDKKFQIGEKSQVYMVNIHCLPLLDVLSE